MHRRTPHLLTAAIRTRPPHPRARSLSPPLPPGPLGPSARLFIFPFPPFFCSDLHRGARPDHAHLRPADRAGRAAHAHPAARHRLPHGRLCLQGEATPSRAAPRRAPTSGPITARALTSPSFSPKSAPSTRAQVTPGIPGERPVRIEMIDAKVRAPLPFFSSLFFFPFFLGAALSHRTALALLCTA